VTATDRAGHRPALLPRVLVSGATLRGPRSVHLIKDPVGGRSFEVGPKEHFLIARLDGTRSLEEIGAAYAREYGRRLGDAHWHRLLGMLASRGLLVGAPEAAPAPAADAPERNTLLRGRLAMVADAEATAKKLHRLFGFLLAVPWMVPLGLLVVAMEVHLALGAGDLVDGTVALFGHPGMFALVAVLLWLSTALHELAHGVVAWHYGGRVTDIGLRWRLPVAIMYCTVDNYLYLRHRRHQVAVAVAGAVMNLLFLLPFWAVRLFVPVDPATAAALDGLLLLGSVQALAMLVPLPPLDGYRIVSHLLGASELAASAGEYVRLRARRDPAAAQYPPAARRAYLAYVATVALTLCALVACVVLLVHHLLT
jgi:putative peptide zinc metalloprotease protein